MRAGKDAVLFRLASVAHSCGFTPNMMTALGLCFGVASGAMFGYRISVLGFGFGFLSVFCDVLDGTLARKFHMETTLGRVFDSVADRACEVAVVLGALAGGIIEPIGLLAIVGSVSLLLFRALSYARGLDTDYVLFGRVERLALILCGLVAPFVTVSTLCFVVAGTLGFVSTVQIIINLLQKKALRR
jgi:phosphatidylglycerophosphate synthase